jgi:UDP-N-acetylglucosamine--N-acetylmuramyl-(pentapeptide) pyrophosphoryl-undecaprenol N-acetylglucosamine transferase
VTLLVSRKEVDQQVVENVAGVRVVALPAVGLTRGGGFAFLRGSLQSYRAARILFRSNPPQAALAMGGFTSAPPILAAKHFGARTFLHEANSIPGRANRWLSRVVDKAFVGFPTAGLGLHLREIECTGTPVRPEFIPRPAAGCRVELGLDPDRPVALVMGGSQGATGINDLMIQSLPLLAQWGPRWQWIHLTGPQDVEQVRSAYAAAGLDARIHEFFSRMAIALGAATVTISRAGASSLAEFAATRSPAILVPFPAAIDNHQYFNARAFVDAGAARILDQKTATPPMLLSLLRELSEDTDARVKMQSALTRWHSPMAARQIADIILNASGIKPSRADGQPADHVRMSSGIGVPVPGGTNPSAPVQPPESGVPNLIKSREKPEVCA